MAEADYGYLPEANLERLIGQWKPWDPGDGAMPNPPADVYLALVELRERRQQANSRPTNYRMLVHPRPDLLLSAQEPVLTANGLDRRLSGLHCRIKELEEAEERRRLALTLRGRWAKPKSKTGKALQRKKGSHG